MSAFPAVLPAALVLAFAGWCGTFYLGASAKGAITGHALLLSAAVAGGLARGRRTGLGGLLDPLDLGRAGKVLLWAAVAAAALAWWTSPVPRAGRVGLALLPAFLLLPRTVAAAWREPRPGGERQRAFGGSRRSAIGVRAVALLVGGVSAWSLGRWIDGGSPLPAEPLGQHLLLTAWVIVLLPLAALPLRERGARGPVWRGVGLIAVALGVAVVLTARTLTGALALALEAGIGALLLSRRGERAEPAGPSELRRSRRLRSLATVLCGVGLAAALVLLVVAARAGDPSLRARWAYWSGGWTGLQASPWTGFGPGATAWTLAGSLRPVPGATPPGEVVGDLHLLPLAMAYEIGWPGLALAAAVAVVFFLRRIRESGAGPWFGGSARHRASGEAPASGRSPSAASDPVLTVAGLCGLAGAGVMGLATADWRVTALPVAVALAAGAALSGGEPHPGADESSRNRAGRHRHARLAAIAACALYAVVAGTVLFPVDRAHWIYDGILGRSEETPDALALLDRTSRLDAEFPLYRFHAVRDRWLGSPEPGSLELEARRDEAAREALRAASKARGVAVFWLRGGAAAAAAGAPAVAAPAFELACALDPLGAMAPFSLLAVRSPLHRPEALGARALAAEPRLAAALLWEERPEVLESALTTLAAAEGIDEGWRQEMIRRARRLPRGSVAGPVAHVALVVDARADSDSLSLHAFRRLPRRAELIPVPVRRRGAEAMAGVPPATSLEGTDPRLFPATCTGPFAPQILRKSLWKTR